MESDSLAVAGCTHDCLVREAVDGRLVRMTQIAVVAHRADGTAGPRCVCVPAVVNPRFGPATLREGAEVRRFD